MRRGRRRRGGGARRDHARRRPDRGGHHADGAFQEARRPGAAKLAQRPADVLRAAALNGDPRGRVTPTTVLTIAGSDSGGGAGIQADLKIFAALGAYGTSRDHRRHRAEHPGRGRRPAAAPATVTDQLDSVLGDFAVRAVKTGMLGTPAVADGWPTRRRPGGCPTWSSTRCWSPPVDTGSAWSTAVERLLPYAEVATPNCAEAAALTGRPVTTVEEMVAAAEALAAGGPAHVVVTGGDVDAAGESSTCWPAAGRRRCCARPGWPPGTTTAPAARSRRRSPSGWRRATRCRSRSPPPRST